MAITITGGSSGLHCHYGNNNSNTYWRRLCDAYSGSASNLGNAVTFQNPRKLQRGYLAFVWASKGIFTQRAFHIPPYKDPSLPLVQFT